VISPLDSVGNQAGVIRRQMHMMRTAIGLATLLVIGACGGDAVEFGDVDEPIVAIAEDKITDTAVADPAPITTLTAVPVERVPLDCNPHVNGTGDLAQDLLGTWRFVSNVSPWNITLFEDGSASGIRGTDMFGHPTTWFESEWTLEGNVLTMETPQADFNEFVFVEDAEFGWRFAGSLSLGWRRCGFFDPRFVGSDR